MSSIQILYSSNGTEARSTHALENLAPGEKLVAQVREDLGSGHYRLQVGGQSVVAESTEFLRESEVIRLEVKSVAPRIVLSLSLLGQEGGASNVTGASPLPGISGELLTQLDRYLTTLPAAQRDTLLNYLTNALDSLPLNDRTLLVSRLFVENGIEPPAELVRHLADTLFTSPTHGGGKDALPTTGGAQATTSFLNPAQISENLLTILRAGSGNTGVLDDAIARLLTPQLETILASRPELGAIDRLLGALDDGALRAGQGESPATTSRIAEETRELLALIQREGRDVPESATRAVRDALASGDLARLKTALVQLEGHLLARLPELEVLRDVMKLNTSSPQREAGDLVNALGRFSDQPFFFREWVIPIGEEKVPLKFKARFRKSKDGKKIGGVERVVIDLDLSKTGRVVGEITVRGKQLSLVFRLERPEVEQVFLKHAGDIERSLGELGFKTQARVLELKKHRHPLLEEVPEFSLERGRVDVTA